MAERVLVLAAHPDDETISMGATISKHCAAGDTVRVVAFADGVGARGFSVALKNARHGMMRRACHILGGDNVGVFLHQYADNQMDTLPLLTITQHVEIHVREVQPTIVYTHWSGDLNVDHRVMHDAVNVACRPQLGCSVRRLLYFEVPCSTAWGGTFQPDYFVPCEDTIEAKLVACAEYAEELREYPHPRSLTGIRNLALMRGASVGVPYAEAFKVGRVIT